MSPNENLLQLQPGMNFRSSVARKIIFLIFYDIEFKKKKSKSKDFYIQHPGSLESVSVTYNTQPSVTVARLVRAYLSNKMGSNNGKPVLREEDVLNLVTTSGMTAQEVRDAFTAFVTEHPNGKLKAKDFRKLMSSALPKKDAAKMEKHVFRIYDENNDGHVDFVEFMVKSVFPATVFLNLRVSSVHFEVSQTPPESRRPSCAGR